MQAGAAPWRGGENLRFCAVVSGGALWPDARPFSPAPSVYEVKVRDGVGGGRTHGDIVVVCLPSGVKYAAEGKL